MLDADIFLSYLLSPTTKRAIITVVNTCLTSDIELLVPHELVAEISKTARSKRYFRERIPHRSIDQFISQITTLAQLLPSLDEISAYGRDPADNYLLAYGVVNEADYLVTGDSDLLVLGQVGALQIVKPSAFLVVRERQGLVE
jgi:putative PIN family toxin of toxin-antitoxin system